MDAPTLLLAVFGLGSTEILVILFIVLLLFGAKKLPELARGLGKSMNEFKKASSELEREVNADPEEPAAKPAGDKKPDPAGARPTHGSN